MIGVLMPFGLGLGILFLALYPGRSANRFGLLTGQVVSVDNPQVVTLAVVAGVVLVALLLIWRPLLFASVDEDVATARGVPVRTLSLVFMVLLALTVVDRGADRRGAARARPARDARRGRAAGRLRPLAVSLLSMAFAVVSIVGGILLALGAAIPISPYVTTISFAIYLVCRLIGRRGRAAGGRRLPAVRRQTWQRAAVRDALSEREGFVSAQDLHTALQGDRLPHRARDRLPGARGSRRRRRRRLAAVRRRARTSTAPACPRGTTTT